MQLLFLLAPVGGLILLLTMQSLEEWPQRPDAAPGADDEAGQRRHVRRSVTGRGAGSPDAT